MSTERTTNAKRKPCKRECPARARRGFTLLELVIVVLILGIVTAVAAPRHQDSLQHFRVEAAARRVAADLEFARRAARQAGASRTVQFDASADQYVLLGLKNPDHPTADYTVRLATSGYPADLHQPSFDGTSEVTFDLDGRPWAGSPLAPLGGGSVVVRSGSQQRTIAIDPVTGRARIE